jgi:hypothetical protein
VPYHRRRLPPPSDSPLGSVWLEGRSRMKRDGTGSSHFRWCLVWSQDDGIKDIPFRSGIRLSPKNWRMRTSLFAHVAAVTALIQAHRPRLLPSVPLLPPYERMREAGRCATEARWPSSWERTVRRCQEVRRTRSHARPGVATDQELRGEEVRR